MPTLVPTEARAYDSSVRGRRSVSRNKIALTIESLKVV
jgi:hypothetical protein